MTFQRKLSELLVTYFKANELAELLDGYYLDDFSNDCFINNFEFDPSHLRNITNQNSAFISISNERWNKVHRKSTQWIDGNIKIMSCYQSCKLIITEKPILELQLKVPQLIVDNSYETIKKLARAARLKMKNPVIGITGSVGKSTTRLMLEYILQENHKIVSTRGNHNTQAGVQLYGAKLCKNPDIGILEISLNALNNRGNQSLVIEPDVCIVTSIGEAHLSTIHSIENIAKFKARIFHGLKPNGIAIINHDIDHFEFNILTEAAKLKTTLIKTYSLTNNDADLYLKDTFLSKYKTQAVFHYKENDYHFEIKLPSTGTIENALAVFLCLVELGYDLNTLLPKIYNFSSLDRIMELKQLTTSDGRAIDLIDDSHNAAVPSMINAIQTFKAKQFFYKGTKILALGQISDLGEKSEELHDTLLPEILSSGADYIFGHGHYMRRIIEKLPAKIVGGWFDNAKDFSKRIPFYCSNDSLIMLKGSVSGSDFRVSSHLLPNQINKSTTKLTDYSPPSLARVLQPVYGLNGYNISNNDKLFSKGSALSQSIEGLGHIVLLLLILKKRTQKGNQTTLNKWRTNEGFSLFGKAFKTGEVFSHQELIEELIHTQHPSATFELSFINFGTRNKAMKKVVEYADSIGLSPSSTLNITGRYRLKEQQSYNLEDMQKLGKQFHEFKQQLSIIYDDGSHVITGIVLGKIRLSCIGYYQNLMICIIGMESKQELDKLLSTIITEYIED